VLYPSIRGRRLRFPRESPSQISSLASIWFGKVRAWRSLQGDETSEGSRPKRTSRVLRKCLSESLGTMHAACSLVLLHAVEALVVGRRLTLMDCSA
jgi:hypothetical protein